MAKKLLVYYSRSGMTEKVAKKLAETFEGDVDQVIYGQKKKVGFIPACIEGITKQTAEITGDNHSPSQYDHIVFMTPIWASRCSTPIRSYIRKFRNSINSYSVLATSNSTGIDGVVAEFAETLGKAPTATQILHLESIKSGAFEIDEAIRG